MSVKFLGQVTLSSAGFQIQRTDGAYSTRTVTLADGTYYLSTDGEASDIFVEIQAKVRAAGVELSGFTATMASGRVDLAMPAGQTAVITWTDDETRDILGFAGTSTSLVPDARASGASPYWCGLAYCLVQDNPVIRHLRSTSRADDGSISTHAYGRHRDHTIRIRYSGWYRSAVLTEWHTLLAFFDTVAGPGLPFRLYPDAPTQLDSFVAVSNPQGFETWILADPLTLEPREFTPGAKIDFIEDWTLSAADDNTASGGLPGPAPDLWVDELGNNFTDELGNYFRL